MISNLPDDEEKKKTLVEPEESEKDDTSVKTSYHSLRDDDHLDDENEDEGDVSADEEEEDEENEKEEEAEETEEPKESEERPEHKFKQEYIEQPEPKTNDHDQYYLQVVKTGEAPEWPRPKEDLDVFSQPLDGGLIQYWAYPKDIGKTADNMPHAEEIANHNKSDSPAIIIDQISDHLTTGSCLELILVKDGHALAKTESNLDNLESNITSLLDSGKQSFGITAEHFMSTSNVFPEVEKRLDDLEEAETEEKEDMPEEKERDQNPYFAERPAIISERKRSKIVVFIPILVLIIIFGGVVFYRDKLLAKVMNKINPPKPAVIKVTPTPTPIPTPTITLERFKYKVRVLNGTPKTGAAGVLADKLKTLGWQIDKTGNATSSAIAESYVRSKTGQDNAVKVLIADVSDYEAASSSADLKPADKADLEFVIGKK